MCLQAVYSSLATSFSSQLSDFYLLFPLQAGTGCGSRQPLQHLEYLNALGKGSLIFFMRYMAMTTAHTIQMKIASRKIAILAKSTVRIILRDISANIHVPISCTDYRLTILLPYIIYKQYALFNQGRTPRSLIVEKREWAKNMPLWPQAYIKDIGICGNTYYIYYKNTIQIYMSDEPNAKMQPSNIQQEEPSSSPAFQGALEMARRSIEHPSSFITGILNPPSIFASSATIPTLSDYLKIKTKDKPKDTLKEIQDKKEAFVSYISPEACTDQNTVKKESTNGNVSSRVRQQYPQFTFYKCCLENILLFIRIAPSRVSKCNITICNIRGEVIKYYPNVFLSKKEGKIAKYISENKQSFVIVYDYTAVDSTVKVFPSLLNEAPMLYYVIFNINVPQEVLKPVCDKIQEGKRGTLEHIDSKVYLISHSVLAFKSNEEMNDIFSKLSHIQDEQQHFLIQFRGKKQSCDRNLAFDMMIINMWRQFALQGPQLIEKILQMFTQKEKEVSQTIVNDPQILHTPKRLQSSQNCSLCLAKNGQTKRPRRTYWICTCCSAEKEKPIYLCKGCFRDYHTNNHVYLYRKNEKKTKKYQRIIRQRIGRNRKDIKLQEKTAKHAVTHSDRTLLELDRKCDEFFARLDDLIEGKCYAPAQFYIQMLTNLSIVKTHQYLKQISANTEIDLIKQEQQ